MQRDAEMSAMVAVANSFRERLAIVQQSRITSEVSMESRRLIQHFYLLISMPLYVRMCHNAVFGFVDASLTFAKFQKGSEPIEKESAVATSQNGSLEN